MGKPSPPVLTREEVGKRILAGDNLVILRDQVLRIPSSWLTSHPGGALAILHFVGRDATDEVDAFHSAPTLEKMKRYVIGTVDVSEHAWKPFVPPIMSGWVRRTGKDGAREWFNEASAVRSSTDTVDAPSSQILLFKSDETSRSGPTLATIEPPPSSLSLKTAAKHSEAYKALHQRIIDAGLYQCPYLSGYGQEVLRYTFFLVTSIVAYRCKWFLTSAFFLGLLWHQITFTAHDLGHVGVTHNWTIDRLFGILIADFIGGLSIGWWVDNHNTHHLVTNHPSHDPDIQHLPFFAISPVFLRSLYSSYYKRVLPFDAASKIFIRIQHKLFYVIMAFARFNLYRLSWTFLAKNAFAPRKAMGGRWWWWTEMIGLACFFTWYGLVLKGCGTWGTRLGFLLISHVVPSPLHVQIVLSHFSRSTADLGPSESFVARQLRTTVDVICDPSIEFIHGGLHLQVTHHLFPRLPRHNLRKASLLVKEFAKEHGLEYAEFGFLEGNGEVRSVLKQVADQVKIVGMVAEANVREAIEGH
ncbi:fatty acid/sphingolipid desaturase [Panus rudis PR-1116 ss-1]|nr:fatty acid/sphingolipid desaturase [Panus rudis PR-1116 ss-1]